MTVVLDASAVLAYLRDEPGSDAVALVLEAWVDDPASPALVSAVSWIEIAERVADGDVLDGLAEVTELVALERDVAELAAGLRPTTRHLGLSVADRSCLAVAIHRTVPVLTADRAWAGLTLGVEVRLIR